MTRRTLDRIPSRVSLRACLVGVLASVALSNAHVAAQSCIPSQVSFTPSSCPNPTSAVVKAWGGRFYSSFHRRLGTPPAQTDYLWVGEDGGRISCSTDEGKNWTNQVVPPGVDGEVRGLYFLSDAVTGWAVTTDGWVLKTTDGGSCWEKLAYFQTGSEEGELWDVYFFGVSRGFLVGANLLKSTVDGGATWNDEPVTSAFPLCPTTGEAEIYSVDAVGTLPNYMAVAASEPGQILYRTNAMSEWDVALTPTSFCAGDPNHALESWDIKIAPGSTATAGVAYAVIGQGNGCGTIHRGVYDTGATPVWTWTEELHECIGAPSCPRTSPATTDMIGCDIDGAGYGFFKALYGVLPVDQDLALAVGYGAGIFYRDAASATWIEVTDKQYFSSAPLGTIVGDGDGKAWLFGEYGDQRVLDIASLAPFQAVSPFNPTQPARPFSALAPQTGWRLSELWFSDATTGWAVGQIGRIVRWDNTNSTWVQVRSGCLGGPPAAPLTSIVFGNSSNGVAVGWTNKDTANHDLAQVFLTRIGGQSAGAWSDLSSTYAYPYPGAAPKNLADVAYRPGTNPPEYWAVGVDGFALKVHKPSTAWLLADGSLPSGGGNTLSAIEFVDSSTAVVVGSNGSSGKAWKLNVSTSPPTWTALTLPSGVASLNDVATVGSKVWLIGSPTSSVATVLYNSNFTSSPNSFSHLTAAETAASGANLAAIDAVMGTSNPEVMIGGLNGVLLHSTNNTSWTSLDSDTAKHLTSLSMPVAGKAWIMGTGVKFENNDAITLRYD